ncbi:MAG: ParB/RepB/Spo0J family partition protein [Ardenticatenaceae bacterium]
MNQKADLFTIRPDPNQPRSLLPVDLAGLFENGLMSPEAIISEWQKEPNQALSGITKLADSIAQHGLINPISVQPAPANFSKGIKYLIVTGERRWWAHVLLWTQGRDISSGDARYPANQIKINLTAKGVSIRAHQLIENVVREDINAVEKAHGMWALRYELSERNYGSILPTPAQERYLVDWREVEKSLGVSNRYRQYVISVLKLTGDALKLVQQHGLSESTIRPITQKLHKHPTLQIQALRQLIAWQKSENKHSLVREVKSLVDQLVGQIQKKSDTPRPSLLPLEIKETKKKHA